MFVQNRLGLIEGVETMRAQEERMNQISNNLANVDTTGYKREHITFWEMLHKTEGGDSRVGKGLKILTDHSQGPASLTGNPLDLLIGGEGFFRIQTPDGVRYSRDGSFLTNDIGQLVTSTGFPVLGEGGTIIIEEGKEFVVERDGTVALDGQIVNKLSIVSFDDLTQLEKQGQNLFRLKEGDAAEILPEEIRLIQGSLEKANISTTIELTEMIELQRNFQSQQKLIQIINDIDGQAVSRVGRLTT